MEQNSAAQPLVTDVVAKQPSTETKRLSLKEKLAYGAGDLGNGFMFDLGQIYLLKFYTDVLGISAAYAGLVFLVSKLFDAFVDSGVGTYVDSRKNIGKRGKFRPFILFGTVPLAIITIISFLSPDLSQNGKIIWAFVTYMLFNACYSIVNIPYGSLAASMTKNPVDRAGLASFRSLGSQAALFITGIVVIPIVMKFEDPAVGYPVAIGMMAAIGVLFHLICYFGVKETEVVVKKEEAKQPIGKAFVALLKNRPFIILVTLTLFMILANFLKLGVQLFYVQYNLGNANLIGSISTVNLIMALAGITITTPLVAKVGKKSAVVIGLAGSVTFEVLNYLFFGDSIGTFLTFHAIGYFFFMIPNTIIWALIADIVEYGEWMTGERTEGVIYLLTASLEKCLKLWQVSFLGLF
jgi:GPH family glycoside/pentoside/hexuronide:cation symporter